MNPRVKQVTPLPDYMLRLKFTNDEVRIYDVKPLLEKGVFRDLRDESMFRSAHLWHGTVQWSGGQDICPDTLYEESVPLDKTAQVSVHETNSIPAEPRSRSKVSSRS